MGDSEHSVGDQDVDELALLTQPGREEDLQTFLLLIHPADVAELLSEAKESTVLALLAHVEPERAAELVSELDPEDQERVLKLARPEELGAIVHQMDTDDAVDLLQELDEGTAERVLAQMPDADRKEVSQLLAFDPASAGGLMQTELVKVPINASVQEAIEAARAATGDVEILSLFVVDDVGRYAGQVALQDLIFSKTDTPVEQIMKAKPAEVETEVDQEEVARLFDHYSLVELGVVDKHGILVGRITADDVHEVLVEEHGEDLLKMAGTAGEPEALYSSNVFRVVGQRLPWLLVTLLGALLAAYILNHTLGLLRSASVLLAFIPVLTSMSSILGTQSATIMIRGIALDRIDPSEIWGHVAQDALVSAIMGVICGSTVALLVSLWRGQPLLGVCVGLSLALSMAFASILGTLEPPLLRRLGIDPMNAVGPLLTTLNNISGVLIYTLISVLFLEHLQ